MFAPLNKHSLRLGGLTQEDELRYMQERFDVPRLRLRIQHHQGLWTSRVTSHVPIREVAAAHHRRRACGTPCTSSTTALRRAGIARAAHRGLGPQPACRRRRLDRPEEIEVIEPAVRALQAEGIDARGPFSPDTVFIGARRGDVDAVVSMYHDQGQIAMKLMGFDNGVTLHGGLPVPVATSASGSAFDIAGKGIANIEGLQHAFDLCVRMGREQAAVPA